MSATLLYRMLKVSLASAALLSLATALKAVDVPDTSTWVQFSSFSYSGQSTTTPKDDISLNLIIAGFYPDPSICRVGDDYFKSLFQLELTRAFEINWSFVPTQN